MRRSLLLRDFYKWLQERPLPYLVEGRLFDRVIQERESVSFLVRVSFLTHVRVFVRV